MVHELLGVWHVRVTRIFLPESTTASQAERGESSSAASWNGRRITR